MYNDCFNPVALSKCELLVILEKTCVSNADSLWHVTSGPASLRVASELWFILGRSGLKKGTFMALRTQMGETQPGFPQKVHKPRTKFFLYSYLGKT